MDTKYQIGQTVYHGYATREPVLELCPVCNGNEWVTLVLGNGAQVQIECEYCVRQREDTPAGHVKERYVYSPVVDEIWISGLEVNYKGTRYRCGSDNAYRTFDEEDLYATYEEAWEYASKCVTESLVQEEENLHKKTKQNKSYSWNVGYHMRKLVDLERERNYHESKIKVLKTHVRKETK